jgi:hypothetical protein
MKTLCLSFLFATLFLCAGCRQTAGTEAARTSSDAFVRIDGHDLVTPSGEKLLIRGTNLGNWLNPEGYMFRFDRTSSAGRINQALCEMVGPDRMEEFWALYKDNYITRDDILFLARTGCNTIRLPFHYKLFTDEDYMGLSSRQDGFKRIDSLVGWCREAGLYLILDMHDAPGGQTGDNIDDSYGYPWLFDSEASQKKFVDIWVSIAAYYRDEPVILGYEFINEPIAPYFDTETLNAKLEPLYRRTLTEVRKVDTNHIILLGGSQWNSNFAPLSDDASFDDKVMYTCHRYGGEASAEAIRGFIDFRDRVNRPMYMGEIGHNTDEWMSSFCRVMEDNNIGWTFWPYKKMGGSSFVTVNDPGNWDVVVSFVESGRSTYRDIREARPAQDITWQALLDLAHNSLFNNCTINTTYITAVTTTGRLY